MQTPILSPVAASRRSFLKKSTGVALAGGAVMLGTGTTARAADPAGQEVNFQDLRTHENAHVDFLVRSLGRAARPKPTFRNLEQADYDSFVAVSQALENTGVGAYLGATPFIQSKAYLAAAGSIALVEARHAGYLNTYLGARLTADTDGSGANNAFEDSLTAAKVGTLAGPFIASLNGGPAVTYARTLSASNDIAILNFALALEYLERDFYNINVPKFFGG